MNHINTVDCKCDFCILPKGEIIKAENYTPPEPRDFEISFPDYEE